MSLNETLHCENFTNNSFTRRDCYGNFTNTQHIGRILTNFDIAIIAVLILIIVCGFLGNSYVIYMLSVQKKHSKHWFEQRILLLAFIDLLSSVYVPSLFIYGTITGFERWHFGVIACKVLVSIFPLTVSLSQGLLVCISYERYQHISALMPQPSSRKMFMRYFGVVIIIALVLVFPYAYVLTIEQETCGTTGDIWHQVHVTGNVIRDLLAMFLMCHWSLKTIRILKETDQRLKGIVMRRSSQQVTRLLTVMIVTFTLCVTPVDMFQCVILFLPEDLELEHSVAYMINTILVTLQISNSVSNVLIYSKMHKDLRIKCNPSFGFKQEKQSRDPDEKNLTLYASVRTSESVQ